ncbi:hypothetical protein ScPMuIL_015883 [Solemya velum]
MIPRSLLYFTILSGMVTLLNSFGAAASPRRCFCTSDALCRRIVSQPHETEVVVVTEGKSLYKNWMWESIKTVISHNYTDPELMCYAHSQGAKFGFIAKVPGVKSKDDASLADFIKDTKVHLVDTYADVLVLDLLDLVDCTTQADSIGNLTDIVLKVVMEAKPTTSSLTKVMCIVPWKPPCFNNDCGFLINISKDNRGCDFFISNPESYTFECHSTCKARATVPFQKLAIGTDEYLTFIKNQQLLVGIPWHAYDYTCKEMNDNNCMLSKRDNSSDCDYEGSRKKIGLSDWRHTHPNYDGSWDNHQKAMYFNYNNTSDATKHQVWYEGFESLHEKYQFVKQLELKGVVIWTGDDLTYANLNFDMKVSDNVWSWLLHTILATGEVEKHSGFDLAGNMAGVGVGCFLFGTAMGVAIAALLFRKKFMGKRRRPFQKDVDEYHDEDQQL